MKKFVATLLMLSMILSAFGAITSVSASVISTGGFLVEVDPYNITDGSVSTAWGFPAFQPGSYQVYQIESPSDAKYLLELEYSCDMDARLLVSLNDEQITNVSLPTPGDKKDVCELNLKHGTNLLKLTIQSRGIMVKKLNLVKVAEINDVNGRTEGAFRNNVIPCIIQAEDFDRGSSGSYSDTKNVDVTLRSDSDLKIEKIDNQTCVVAMSKGDWAKYTFDVNKKGKYSLIMNYTGTAEIEMYVDDEKYTYLSLEQNEYEKSDTVVLELAQKKHTIRFLIKEGYVNLDYFQLKSAPDSIAVSPRIDTDKVYMDIYVSPDGDDNADGSQAAPYKTILRAKKKALEVSDDMTGNIVIHIADGTYRLNETLNFTSEDSGKNGYKIIYKGDNLMTKPLISGGEKVENWEKADEYVWKAKVENVEDTRQFYVNGYAAQRARSKYVYSPIEYYHKEGSKFENDGLILSANNFPEIKNNIQGVELVWKYVWANQRTLVENIIDLGEGKIALEMKQPYWIGAVTLPHYSASASAQRSFYIENAKELLDEPGEWYYDKNEKTIYYYPYKAENLLNADCWLSRLDTMVSIQGNEPDNKIHDIEFDNLDFRYGTWLEPNERGVVQNLAEYFYEIEMNDELKDYTRYLPGQVHINNAKNINIKNCSFINLGSAAVAMRNAVTNCNVSGNLFRDISGTAVSVGMTDVRFKEPLDVKRPQGISISNNVVRRVGQDYLGTPGIAVYYVGHTNIEHNDIKDVPYTGILCGWGWNVRYDDFSCNSVVGNKVENVLTVAKDGANIYTLGDMPGTVVTRNHLIKSGDRRGGIYHDDYSRNITTTYNVVEQCQNWLYLWRPSIKNINAQYNFSDTESMVNEAVESTIANNTVVKDGNWPQAALDIIKNAGVEGKYKNLLYHTELPEWMPDKHQEIPTNLFASGSSIRIMAADYQNGGEGVGYHDTTPGNNGKAYKDEDVDIWKSSTIANAYDVGVDDSEWMRYDLTIPKSGTYAIRAWTMNMTDENAVQPKMDILLDDKTVLSDVPIKNTGASNNYTYIDVGELALDEGSYMLKILGKDAFFGITFIEFLQKQEGQNSVSDFDEGVYSIEQPIRKKKNFIDITGHWAENDIKKALEQNLIFGTSENEFSPDLCITRNQAVIILLRSMGIDDTETDWRIEAVRLGVFTENEAYDNDFIVTREQFVNMLMSAYEKRNGKYNLDYDKKAFNDFEAIETAYVTPILGAKELGLIYGDENQEFHPKNTLTRAEAISIINRYNGLK